MKKITISIIGAGSSYTPELMDMMARMRDTLDVGEVRLYDIDAERLSIMEGFCRRFMDHAGYPARLSATLDRVQAIRGADFIVTQIRGGRQQGARGRREDPAEVRPFGAGDHRRGRLCQGAAHHPGDAGHRKGRGTSQPPGMGDQLHQPHGDRRGGGHQAHRRALHFAVRRRAASGQHAV